VLAIMTTSVEALRLGVTFRPPNLLLLYKDGSGRTRRRRMPLTGLSKSSDAYAEAQILKERHNRFLGSLPAVRVEKFLRLLQETMKGRTLTEALVAVRREFAIDFDEDMNKLSDRDLQRRKEIMDLNFKKNQVITHHSGQPRRLFHSWRATCTDRRLLLIAGGAGRPRLRLRQEGRLLAPGEGGVRLGRRGGRRPSGGGGLLGLNAELQRLLPEGQGDHG